VAVIIILILTYELSERFTCVLSDCDQVLLYTLGLKIAFDKVYDELHLLIVILVISFHNFQLASQGSSIWY
jgi:hypothetical protein